MRRDEPGWCVAMCHSGNVYHAGSTTEARRMINIYLLGVRGSMIQRIRIANPDGHDIIRDVAHGGGPIGDPDVRSIRYTHEPATVNARPVGHMDPPNPLDIFSTNESKKRAQRRWRERQKAKA